MTTFRDKMSGRSFVISYLSLIALFNLVLGIQGFDMCDEGWVLSGFQQIFNDPKSVQYLFLYYFSEYLGGIWNCLFGNYGIFAFRVLTVICITITSYVIYRMFHRYFNRWCILFGMFWVFLCAGYGIMVFYHDYLTTLLSVCASFCLFNALMKNNCLWLFVSGTIIGINVFARLPNLALSLLILTLIPYYIYNKDKKQVLRMLVSAFAGFVIGVGMILLLIVLSGHYDIFLQAIKDGFSATSDDKSTHNISEMACRYLDNYQNIILNVILITLVPVIVWKTRKCCRNRYVKICFGTIIVLLYILLLRFTSSNIITLYSVSTFLCIYVLFSGKYKKDYVYLACIIMINMYALPLGSDYGVDNMGEYCLYMSGPMAVGLSWQWVKKLYQKNHSTNYLFILCFSIFVIFVVKRGGYSIMSHCYFDDGYRWHKTYLIDNPLATTYTTKRNCEQLNPMLRELSKYVNEDDYLLCFQNIATVHFLTCTRPYLYNPWVWTYDPTNMQRKFKEAESCHDKLPVVVRDKSMLPNWYEFYPDWNNENAEESYCHKNEKIALINHFLSSHGYILVWENEVFQILIPPSFEQ